MPKISNARHRFLAEFFRCALYLYFRFRLSYRDAEDLLSERGIDVSCETVRRWALKFGQVYATRLRRFRSRSDTWSYADEMFGSINGLHMVPWWGIDCAGDVAGFLVQSLRHQKATLRFMRNLQKKQDLVPDTFATDNCSPSAPMGPTRLIF